MVPRVNKTYVKLELREVVNQFSPNIGNSVGLVFPPRWTRNLLAGYGQPELMESVLGRFDQEESNYAAL